MWCWDSAKAIATLRRSLRRNCLRRRCRLLAAALSTPAMFDSVKLFADVAREKTKDTLAGKRLVAVVVVDTTFNNAFISTSPEHQLATPVPSHLGVRLPATPAPRGALEHSCERSKARKLALNSGTTGGARKMTQNASKTHHRCHC